MHPKNGFGMLDLVEDHQQQQQQWQQRARNISIVRHGERVFFPYKYIYTSKENV
jgi:hypothetical protein